MPKLTLGVPRSHHRRNFSVDPATLMIRLCTPPPPEVSFISGGEPHNQTAAIQFAMVSERLCPRQRTRHVAGRLMVGLG